MRKAVLLLFAATLTGTAASGGSFYLSDSSFYQPYAVVHPAGYNGVTGGPIEVKVCIPPGDDEITRPALEAAIEMWIDLTATTENCTACRTIEQGPAGTGEPFSMATVHLHELGHCGVGLGHINWEGSGGTFTRRIIDLPGGHVWPASGNFSVGLLSGHLNTQAIMYSHIDEGTIYSSLVADEINTLQFGMSGMDETAGTSDDYTVTFRITDCASADVEVTYTDLDGGTGLGACLADLEALPTGGLEVHHVLKPFNTDPRAVIEVNNSKRFDVLFANGFETGDTSSWSEVQ